MPLPPGPPPLLALPLPGAGPGAGPGGLLPPSLAGGGPGGFPRALPTGGARPTGRSVSSPGGAGPKSSSPGMPAEGATGRDGGGIAGVGHEGGGGGADPPESTHRGCLWGGSRLRLGRPPALSPPRRRDEFGSRRAGGGRGADEGGFGGALVGSRGTPSSTSARSGGVHDHPGRARAQKLHLPPGALLGWCLKPRRNVSSNSSCPPVHNMCPSGCQARQHTRSWCTLSTSATGGELDGPSTSQYARALACASACLLDPTVAISSSCTGCHANCCIS